MFILNHTVLYTQYFVILTISRQLYHKPLIVCLGSIELILNTPLVLISKHLGAMAGQLELLVVSLEALDNLTVLLRTHLGQLNTHANNMFDIGLNNIRN